MTFLFFILETVPRARKRRIDSGNVRKRTINQQCTADFTSQAADTIIQCHTSQESTFTLSHCSESLVFSLCSSESISSQQAVSDGFGDFENTAQSSESMSTTCSWTISDEAACLSTEELGIYHLIKSKSYNIQM